MAGQDAMDERFLLHPTRATYWFVGTFISIVLFLLVAVPVALNRRSALIIEDVNQYGDPTDRAVAEVQDSLSHELSGLIGFQDTGDVKYSNLYLREVQHIDKLLEDLRPLTPEMGTAVQARFNALQDAVVRWHNDVDSHQLATVQ